MRNRIIEVIESTVVPRKVETVEDSKAQVRVLREAFRRMFGEVEPRLTTRDNQFRFFSEYTPPSAYGRYIKDVRSVFIRQLANSAMREVCSDVILHDGVRNGKIGMFFTVGDFLDLMEELKKVYRVKQVHVWTTQMSTPERKSVIDHAANCVHAVRAFTNYLFSYVISTKNNADFVKLNDKITEIATSAAKEIVDGGGLILTFNTDTIIYSGEFIDVSVDAHYDTHTGIVIGNSPRSYVLIDGKAKASGFSRISPGIVSRNIASEVKSHFGL